MQIKSLQFFLCKTRVVSFTSQQEYHRPAPTVQRPEPTAHCLVPTAHRPALSAPYIALIALSSLLFALCSPLTAQGALLTAQGALLTAKEENSATTNPPIYIAFLWHMHQPIYWPYETVNQTDQNGRYSYSVTDIHNQRIGPYTSWPKNAVQSGINASLQHLGAQVSFSGSLIENLNNLESGGNGNFSNWKSSWNYIKNQNTSLGNPRLDMVGFGYHHPLMGLIDYLDTRKQIQAHKTIMSANFPGAYSKGIFPPENAFSPRMIPALVAEGIEWALVDNIHFDRAANGYPYSTTGNVYEPNKADILNPNPNDWVQLNGLWAPTRNSAKWGRQPHYVEYIDPSTGTSSKIIAVPADRYMGNEDGRGGFGALNYENVMSQLESYNTDPNHPILIVLHHDGDNYGGGSESYYNSNFQNFVNWLSSNPSRFVGTTIQDYLEMFPPDINDVIHVESGSWSGADNGDPEFKKWLGDPDGSGYSPDRNSWGVVTAAKNFVMTAEQINSGSTNTTNAWKYMLNGEASDYWYWDGSQNGIWDSHPTRAVNQAVTYAQTVVNSGTDLTGPTIFQPQREPYNPGATEWGINQPSDMTVWTYVFDVHGLKSVKLKYRSDADGVNSTSSTHNETYTGGSEVNAWVELNMTGTTKSSSTNPFPLYKAKEYTAQITGLNNILLDYYVEAIDSSDNISKSAIQHVWIGENSGGGGGGETSVSWAPVSPTNNDTITITVAGATQGAKLHWGVNNNGSSWQTPNAVYRPAGSTLFGGTGPAVESSMNGPDVDDKLIIKLGPFNNAAQAVSKVAFVIHYNNNTWDNNSGQDYHITLPDSSQPTQSFTMDGQVDASAQLVSSNAGVNLYLGWNNSELYVATQSAQQQGGDIFIFVSDSQRSAIASPWAKAGTVAAWGAFLANESSNNYNAWTDHSATVIKTAGTYLEGTINIQQEFGTIPAKLYIAVGKYQTQDAGSLTAQAPAGNANGNIEPTELYEFDYTFSGVTPPAAPALSSPSNGVSNQTTTLNLQWQTSQGATLYHAQAGIDSLFTSPIVNDSNVNSTIKQLSSLSYSTTYYWRVRAKNAGGWGVWSSVRNFTTQAEPQPPVAPVLASPVDDASNQPTTLNLQWNSSSGATLYHVTVSTDSLFTSPIVNDSLVNSTLKQLTFLAINTTYYWRVRGKNSVGWGAWSSVWNFTTGAPLFSASTSGLLFDSVFIGISKKDSIIISNTGVAPLFISSVTSDNSLFTVTPSNAVIQRSASKAFVVTFAPDSEQTETGTIIFTHNAAGSPDTVTLEGIGVETDLVILNASLLKGWNLVSLPALVANDSASNIFPAAISEAYLYDVNIGYQTSANLEVGVGYWLKFDSARTTSVTGIPFYEDTINVKTGWNIIGSLSDSIQFESVTSIPEGIISSQLFGYNAGYFSSEMLEPARGYWIKVNQDGKLVLRYVGSRATH